MIGTGLLVAVLLVPHGFLLSRLLGVSGEAWLETASKMVPRYLPATAILLLAVGLITLVVGIATAWLVTAYEFRGRRFLAWALILPLAFPAYIVGYTYAGIFDFTGVLQRLLWLVAGKQARLPFGIMNLPGVVFVLSVTLYPYVYLIARASFLRQSGAVLEVARLMGRSGATSMLRVVLPLAWPAIFGGLLLVGMEVLNDYGVAEYYGIDTVTVGIYRTWKGLGRMDTAFSFAALIMLGVLAVMLFERWRRRRLQHQTATAGYRPVQPIPLRGWRALVAILICATPVLLGFLAPVLQLIAWAAITAKDVVDMEFLRLIINSLVLATLVTVVTVSVSIPIVYTSRLYRNRLSQTFSRLAAISYALPGTIIAVSVYSLSTRIDHGIHRFIGEPLGISTGLLISGTFLAMAYGCIVRFMAVAVNPLEAGFERVCGRYDEASRALGASPARTLWRIDLPLLKGTIAAAAILVFVDTLKELPLTLMLRPSTRFDTLAVKAYTLAHDELVPESACAALIILAAGLIPVTLMNKLLVATDA